jgi:hypothetical protein
MKIYLIFKKSMLFSSLLLLTSCYSTSYIYKGNIHQEAVGKSKNEILRSYGVPDRTTDDGANGTVLVYEKFTETTVTNVGASSYGRSSTLGGAIYGNGGIIGGSETRSRSYYSMNGISQTSTDKTYCYLFLNPNNIVYDFKTNYGGLYDSKRCFDKLLTWTLVGMSAVWIVPAIVTVPLAISHQKKAKRNGNICKY